MSALPSQSRYIIGTEACERFSFYGMKSILMLYMTGHLLMSDNWATSTLHIFMGMVICFPWRGPGWRTRSGADIKPFSIFPCFTA